MVEVVPVPFDLCGPHHGSRLGSLAMEMAGLIPSLEKIGVEARVLKVIEVDGTLPGSRAECDTRALDVYAMTRDAVAASIGRESVPLVIGGDHSLSLGSISGALSVYGADLAVIWIDAHMDVNTPDTSPSGNLHGMPLAALTQLQPINGPETRRSVECPWVDSLYALWPHLMAVAPNGGLSRDKVGWLGLRDVDAGEVRNFGRLPGSIAKTMQDVDSESLKGTLQTMERWLRDCGAKAVWISFDVDVLDPVYAPGTGTAVRGGLTYREGHLLAETLYSWFSDSSRPYRLAGLDVVEVNPLRDQNNSTAQVAVEWVCSFFGKTIMHELDPGRNES